MASLQFHRSPPVRPARSARPCPLCSAARCHGAACEEFDLDSLPDEIDLMRVLCAQLRACRDDFLRRSPTVPR